MRKKISLITILILIFHVLLANTPCCLNKVKKGQVYVIKDSFDLHGASILLPNKSILNFQGGKIVNGKVISPYNGKIYVKGDYRNQNPIYYGNFYTVDGVQLTYKLEPINRTFKLYKPLMLWSDISRSDSAYWMIGAQGCFITYHVGNIINKKSTDTVYTINSDQRYILDKDSSIAQKLVPQLINDRINVVGLMFHCENSWDDSYYSSKVANNYKNFIEHKVLLYKKYFPKMKIVYICNEQPWFDSITVKNKTYIEGWNNCLYDLTRFLHKHKLKVGIKFARFVDGSKSVKFMSNLLLKSMDYLSVNFYPYSGDANKHNLYNSNINRGESNSIKDYITMVKGRGKKIEKISITENGTLPYLESLPSPWQYEKRKNEDPDVIDIFIKTTRKILDAAPVKTDFINVWFYDSFDKLNNRDILDRVYKGYLN